MKQDNSTINSRMEVRTVRAARWRSIEQSLDEIKNWTQKQPLPHFV